MELVSYNGVTFTALGVTAPHFDDPSSPGADRQVDAQPRLSADPMPGGVTTGVQTITALFSPNGASNPVEATLMKVLAALDLDDPYPKTLAGKLVDGTTVTTQATVGTYRYPNTNTLAVDFVLTEAWSGTGITTLKAAGIVNADGSFANTAQTGNRDTEPTITIGSFSRSGTKTADYGFDTKVSVTLTNAGSEPLINYPYQLGPFDTATQVAAGLMQADGDDLRIFADGVEWPRTLIGMNTALTFIWVVIPWLAPTQSATIDMVFSNTASASPAALSFSSDPRRPAIDISGAGYANNNGSTTTTVTVTGAGWETDQWKGGTVISGSVTSPQMRRAAGNTSTVLTVTRAWSTLISTTDVTVIKSGLMGDGGTASAASGSSLTDSSQTWRTNEWIGATVRITSGTGSGSTGTVTGNTGTALTVSGWSGTTPAASSSYVVYQPNGIWMWDVRQPPKTTNYPGLWQANKIQAPPTQVVFDAPGSWYRFTYQPNRDTYSQPRYDSFSVGVGDYDHVPIMNIQRARSGKSGTQTEIGIADAIGVSSPAPINGIWFGYTLRNATKKGSTEGMCEARFMTQEAGGELWSTFLSDAAEHSSTATISPAWYDLTGYGSPNRVAMTLIPNGGDEIPSQDNNTAQLRSTGSYVALAVNAAAAITSSIDWIGAAPSLLTCGDPYLIIRRGGASATPPYHRLVIGGPGHRVFLRYIGGTFSEQVKIDGAAHRVTLVDSTGAFIRDLPYAVEAQEIVEDADGTDRTLVSARWLPIPPVSVDSDDTYFSDPSGAGWGTLSLAVTGRLGYRT